MKLSTSAKDGRVAFYGNDKLLFSVTPEVAEQLAADLPCKASAARRGGRPKTNPNSFRLPTLITTGAN